VDDESQSIGELSSIEKLFIELAGEEQEVGWIALKQILDHSMQNREWCYKYDFLLC